MGSTALRLLIPFLYFWQVIDMDGKDEVRSQSYRIDIPCRSFLVSAIISAEDVARRALPLMYVTLLW